MADCFTAKPMPWRCTGRSRAMNTLAPSCAVALAMPPQPASTASATTDRAPAATTAWTVADDTSAVASARRGPMRSTQRPSRADTSALAPKKQARTTPAVASP